MKIRSMWLTLTFALLPHLALAQAHCAAPMEGNDHWSVASPESVGLRRGRLCAMVPVLGDWKAANVHAVLVVRHGALVFEHYFSGPDESGGGMPLGVVTFDSQTLHDLRSVTKSVVSLLVGIALDRGWITSIDQPVFSFFPEYADLRTPEKDRITLRHLLTMSAGLAWDEDLPYSDPANSERQMAIAADQGRFILEQPVVTPPGQVYNYSGGATTLLAAILYKVTSKPVDELARTLLTERLDIAEMEWRRYADGKPNAASGLRLRPRDLAKIGQMVLQHGMWNGEAVVPSSWIDEATAPQINGAGLYFYGYQFWIGRSLINKNPVEWFTGVGFGGQRLFIVPALDLVVVVHAGLYSGTAGGWIPNVILNQFVLSAVESRP